MITERIAQVAINLVMLPSDERVGQQIQEFGHIETVERWLAGIGPKSACSRISQAVSSVQSVLDHAESSGIDFIVPGDSNWPAQLDDLDTQTPVGLWVRGNIDCTVKLDESISIVGSRASTTYGERVAAELGTEASDADLLVVSGVAFGIDAAAHRGALAAGGVSIGVLACGVDIAYPAAHQGLIERIVERGLVISEIPPGIPPRKQYFLVRNRIIAALTSQTVVVEAAMRSGALSTAHWAQDLGRTVWGIPGPISSASSAGVHFEISQGSMRLMHDLSAPFQNSS